MRMTTQNVLWFIGFFTVACGLVIQYPLTISTQMNEGRSFLGALVFFNSFFTILTNTFLVLVYLAHSSMFAERLSFFRRPVVMATALASIIVVMIVYHLLLAADHNPVGAAAFANLCLHYFGPPLFALWWFVCARTGKLNWSDLPKLLVYPVAYLVYVNVRAAIVSEYPYGFLDITKNGIGGVAPIVGAIVILFLLLGSAIILLDRKKQSALQTA